MRNTTSLIGLLLFVAAGLAGFLTLQATEVRAQQGPVLSGVLPAPGLSALVVTVRSATPTEIAQDSASRGCDVQALGVIVGGDWRIYLSGAPAQVNAGFPERLEASTALFVRCSTAAVGPPPRDCDEDVTEDMLLLLNERAGFGADVTGAALGCVYHVTNNDNDGPGSLRRGARQGGNWIVFDGDFSIRPCSSEIKVASNTTIDGRGRNIELTGGGLEFESGAENVIITDVTIRDSCEGGRDLVNVSNGATRFWLHHLTLHGASDEYINIAWALPDQLVTGTISWVRFDGVTEESSSSARRDEFAILIGDGQAPDTNHLIRVTMHHNFFNGIYTRNPSVNGAVAHLYNNVISWRLKGIQAKRENSDGVRSERGAEVVSEGDVFDAIVADRTDDAIDIKDDTTRVRVVDPLLLNGATVKENNPGAAFDPREFYSYFVEPAASIADSVRALAGVR